jgi:hypothetical protein
MMLDCIFACDTNVRGRALQQGTRQGRSLILIACRVVQLSLADLGRSERRPCTEATMTDWDACFG